MYLTIILAGLAGGIVRGLVGFIKHQFSYKNVGFNPWYFAEMMLVSGIIGLMTAISVKAAGLFQEPGYLNFGLAFIIGYAGGDFLENIYKIILKKASLYE
jgi:hypothetical protein